MPRRGCHVARVLFLAVALGMAGSPAVAQLSTLKVEPEALDMGTVAIGKIATGTVKLTNSGTDPIVLSKCVTSCGCTSTNCPTGQALLPGESKAVEVRIAAGEIERRITKEVTFIFEGQDPITVPVTVNIVASVRVEPHRIDPSKDTAGRIVLTASDNRPFRITSMRPPIIEAFPAEDRLEWELYISWDKWRDLGERRRLVLDHTKLQSATMMSVCRGANMNSPRLCRKLLGLHVLAPPSDRRRDSQLSSTVRCLDAQC